MAGTRIKLNSSAMAAMLRSAEVRAALRDAAEPVAARARSSAPVDSGEYRASIRLVDDTTDRAVVRILANDDKAAVVEARTGNLKRALGR